METFTEQLKAYLSQVQVGEGEEKVDTVLEFLWERYSSLCPETDSRAQEAEHKLFPIYEALSYNQAEVLFDLVSELCIAYERAAFLNGVRVGAKLTAELDRDASLP